MRKVIFLVILLSVLNVLNSCKKNKIELSPVVSLMTKQSWAIKSIRQNTNNNGWIDIFSSVPICQKDNKLFFWASDHSLNWDEGFTKCNISDPQTFGYGTWTLSSDETKLSTNNGTGITVEADISVLSDSNLITLNKYISGSDTILTETKYVH